MSGGFMQELLLALPEVFLLTAVCGILLVSVFVSSGDQALGDQASGDQAPGDQALGDQETMPRLTFLALLVYLFLALVGIPHDAQTIFGGAYRTDLMASVLKIGAGLCALLSLLYGRASLRDQRLVQGEYYVLTLSALLGISVLVSAGNFPALYLGLELMSLSLYALVAMSRRPRAVEASMKYFVLGALSSGLLLYGFSLLYGISGSLGFRDIAATFAVGSNEVAISLALLFVICGIAFKLGAAPFHMWVPDVYQGAPLSVTLFIVSAAKLGAFGLVIRLLYEMSGMAIAQWNQFLVPIAALSMIAGNFIAIAQTDLRRMLAYSTIAHMGFLLLGPIAGGESGFIAATFYVLTYVLMSVAVFGLILALSRPGRKAVHLAQYAGMARRDPLSATLLVVLLFSLAGIPPSIGFWAKWFVLLELVRAGHLLLAVLAVLCSVVGAYFYLRLVKLVLFDKPGPRPLPRQENSLARLVLICNVLFIVFFALWPNPLVDLSMYSVRSTIG